HILIGHLPHAFLLLDHLLICHLSCASLRLSCLFVCHLACCHLLGWRPCQRICHTKDFCCLRATPILLRTSAETIAPAESIVPVESITLGPDTSADNGFTEIAETLTGSVQTGTMTKRKLSELEVSNPWSKRLHTRK
ncbi:hypothetical protein JB92DRAFT_2959988, partial [Gautieria morchelliformis]